MDGPPTMLSCYVLLSMLRFFRWKTIRLANRVDQSFTYFIAGSNWLS